MKKIIFLFSFAGLLLLTACNNQDVDFPDFDYTTVYFSYQYPVRTLVLGDDIYDNTLDNAHQCQIMATTGGVYSNDRNISIGVVVDNSLCDGMTFKTTGENIIPMPSAYYKLADDMHILIPSGSLWGGIKVQLTDAFFADANAIKNTYVIPLRMVDVTNADSILSGSSSLTNPNRCIASQWSTVPKDYVMYCVKYINPWHGSYLRRGMDVVKGNNGNAALDNSIVYHNQYVEKDEVCSAVTKSMSEITISLNAKDLSQTNLPYVLVVKFDNDGKAVVSSPADAKYKVSGTGEFVKNGDSWGQKQRNVIHLKYNVDFGDATHSCTDTLVVRDRGVVMETYEPKAVN